MNDPSYYPLVRPVPPQPPAPAAVPEGLRRTGADAPPNDGVPSPVPVPDGPGPGWFS